MSKSIKMSKWPTPYYAVIFTSVLNENIKGYDEMTNQMTELVHHQPGFLGVDSARDKIGITVSYWSSLEAIDNWRTNSQHQSAKNQGKKKWYDSYSLKICKVIQ